VTKPKPTADSIAAARERKTAALAVKLGTSASTTSLSLILQAGTAADDGKGGFTYITDYVGAVSVAPMTGTARYIAWKRVRA